MKTLSFFFPSSIGLKNLFCLPLFRPFLNHITCVYLFLVIISTSYCLTFDFSVLQIKQNLDISIIDDLAPEKDEYFEVVLSDPTGGAKVGYINRILITISNDDGSYLMNLSLRT